MFLPLPELLLPFVVLHSLPCRVGGVGEQGTVRKEEHSSAQGFSRRRLFTCHDVTRESDEATRRGAHDVSDDVVAALAADCPIDCLSAFHETLKLFTQTMSSMLLGNALANTCWKGRGRIGVLERGVGRESAISSEAKPPRWLVALAVFSPFSLPIATPQHRPFSVHQICVSSH